MGRNIDKTVKAYQEWKKKNANKGDFFCEDFKQIYELSKGNIFQAISYARESGFMIGYKCAKREEKR
ncbi:hypothetical protein SAMN05660484_00233 [Eubacterium ruminantium]|uniref:Uncharacterized protein n=1 Tax=Eubacterium ruminantium TaxID=42322 RepID=A0A1T4QV56_9FIRM|nr:hypothetical protein [Eubacterium ruminantium]SCW28283.1 hypothetical protein SAMN05660484_00233 [Eubacterium ruminantium]SDM12094.1 hypothetical protein SAMN04490370_101109 [Eubacterium ruminantium]SKA07659.1 hypothetical protein SAMN02745110_02535 [Eubacterium ruminantium]